MVIGIPENFIKVPTGKIPVQSQTPEEKTEKNDPRNNSKFLNFIKFRTRTYYV